MGRFELNCALPGTGLRSYGHLRKTRLSPALLPSMRCMHVKFAMLWGLGWALLFAGFSTQLRAAEAAKQPLNAEWEFRAINADQHPEVADWHAAQVPGVVQTDLLADHLIPDPFYGDNESRLQWIGLTDWEYRTTFQIDRGNAAT